MRVGGVVHGMGCRYRLHVRDLAGRPDLVFRSDGRVIFVDGCVRHRHGRIAVCGGRFSPTGLTLSLRRSDHDSGLHRTAQT